MSEKLVEIISPEKIAQSLSAFDAKVFSPTPHQRAIISIDSNPLEPAVVIAGAGSGKTETMAARVVYLVANGFVKPEEILGLTFTKKAAGELSHRIRKRLRQLKAAQLIPADLPLNVQVMTYHSYAAQLLTNYGLREGIESVGTPMGEAASWQLANEVVRNYDGVGFEPTLALSTIIERVMDLAKLMLEHNVSAEDVIRCDEKYLVELERINQLTGGKTNEDAKKVARVLMQRKHFAVIADQFISQRRSGENLTFDDQMAYAAQLANLNKDVGELERERYKVVLLDEYQDTSQSQIRTLTALFGNGHPVMAVGDPYQAIYGWRGAAAGTISSFHRDFHTQDFCSQNVFSLPQTFRNDLSILRFANIITDEHKKGEVPQGWSKPKGIDVAQLVARDGAGQGAITIAGRRSIPEEATAIAEYIKPFWNDPARLAKESKVPKTFAVLVRRRAQIPEIDRALREAGIPTQIVGSSGLIYLPEVADIYSLLQVLINPDAGAAMMRFLTGPRMNIGAKDLAALGEFSRTRNRQLEKQYKSDMASLVLGDSDVAEADDRFSGSLIDSLDEIESADRSAFSETGYRRLVDCAAALRRLRAHAARSIADFIHEIADYLDLESELLVSDPSSHARRNIDLFVEEAMNFERSGGTVSEFIKWLEVTDKQESGLKIGSVEVRNDVVQLMTVHTSKGAEWDVVAIPGLALEQFPNTHKAGEHWLGTESHIPFELRGDWAQLPPFSFAPISSNTELKKRVDEFKAFVRAESMQEELRLAYVAVTRAKTHLYLSTSWWRDAEKSKAVSEIFAWARDNAKELGAIVDIPEAEPPTPMERPDDFPESTREWPIDHLGRRRPLFDAAVQAVQNARILELPNHHAMRTWESDAALLLEERNVSPQLIIELPSRLSTSTLVKLHENPEELALSIRRPMPRIYDEYAFRGTAFHNWIESHFNANTLFDDEELDYFDALEEDQKLEELKAKWLSSEWAKKIPHRIEEGFEAIVGGVLVRGRIDAIYKYSESDGERYEVVDWKTGSKTLGESAAVQLAMYRLAWSRIAGVDINRVSAAFHYVPTGKTDRRSDLMSESELVALITRSI